MNNLILCKEVSLEGLFELADKILSSKPKKQFNSKEYLRYIRCELHKNILNVYCYLEKLNIEQVNLLGAKTNKVKLSLDSLLKNVINHPELHFEDYKKINKIILAPDEIKLSKNKRNSILLLKKDGKTYQVVIKTTLNKEENFLTSFRLAEH